MERAVEGGEGRGKGGIDVGQGGGGNAGGKGGGVEAVVGHEDHGHIQETGLQAIVAPPEEHIDKVSRVV